MFDSPAQSPQQGRNLNVKQLLTGTVVGGMAMLALGYLLWDVVLAALFVEWSEGDETNWWWVAAGTLVMGLVLSLWLWRSGVTGWLDGAKNGASLGFLIWLGVNILFYGWDGGVLRLHLIDAVIEGIRWGGAGAVVGLVIGRGSVESNRRYRRRDAED
jgi:hypothetical protein